MERDLLWVRAATRLINSLTGVSSEKGGCDGRNTWLLPAHCQPVFSQRTICTLWECQPFAGNPNDIPAPLEGTFSAALGTVLGPAPRQDSQDRLQHPRTPTLGWCDSPACASAQKPLPRRNGRRGGVFISHEVVHPGCTLHSPGSAQAEGGGRCLSLCPARSLLCHRPSQAQPRRAVCVLCSIFSDLPLFFLHSTTAGKRLFIPFLFLCPSTMTGMAA